MPSQFIKHVMKRINILLVLLELDDVDSLETWTLSLLPV